MNKVQIIGIGIGIIGICAYFFTENGNIHTISGALCAIAMLCIFRLPPLKEKETPKDGK